MRPRLPAARRRYAGAVRFSVILGAIAVLASCRPAPLRLSSRGEPSGRVAEVRSPAVHTVPRTTRQVERPEAIACTLRSNRWSGNLELLPGAPYASVVTAGATLDIARTGTTAHVLVSEGGVELEGSLGEPPLYLRRPIALSGFVVPYPDTPLAIGPQHDVGRVQVSLDVSGELSDPPRVVQELSCDDVAPSPGDFDAAAFVKRPQTYDLVRRGAPLSSRRAGPAIARLADGGPSWLVVNADGVGRIDIDTGAFHAVGYVARADFAPPGTRSGSHRARPPHMRPQREPHFYEGMTPQVCPVALTLIAQVAGQRAVVGHFAAGQPFLIDNPDEAPAGLVPITIVADWLTTARGAALLVEEELVRDCPPGPKIPER